MNDKLKILHYLVSLDFGGLQKLVVELSIKQLDDDTDINIMCIVKLLRLHNIVVGGMFKSNLYHSYIIRIR